MVYYKPVKITINIPRLVKVIIDMVMRHYDIPKSIIIDQSLLFISKFSFLLCYFLEIKKKLSTASHSQTDGQTKRQNSIVEAYLWIFVN